MTTLMSLQNDTGLTHATLSPPSLSLQLETLAISIRTRKGLKPAVPTLDQFYVGPSPFARETHTLN